MYFVCFDPNYWRFGPFWSLLSQNNLFARILTWTILAARLMGKLVKSVNCQQKRENLHSPSMSLLSQINYCLIYRLFPLGLHAGLGIVLM